jgi:hypothetical protein
MWDRLKDGLLPEPFTFVSERPYLDEFRAELAGYRTALDAVLGDTFDGVLEIVAQPDVRVVVEGRDEGRPNHPRSRLRLLGVARGDQAYMIRQEPGKTIWHSGGFVLGEYQTAGLAEAVVAEMPVVWAGSLGEVVLPSAPAEPAAAESAADEHSAVEHVAPPGSAVVDPAGDTLRTRAEQFLAAPTTMAGTVRVIQGRSKFGPRGITQHQLEWRDVRDDGRYLITEELARVATGVTPRQVADALDVRIHKVLTVLEGEGLREPPS